MSYIKLTDDQQQAVESTYDKLKEAYVKREPYRGTFVGSAGTGKTTSVFTIVRYLLEDFDEPRILFMSNTHAAVKIINQTMQANGIAFSETIHSCTTASAMGLKPKEVEENQEFHPDPDAYKFDQYDIVIIDESSQLSLAMTEFIMEKGIEERKCILFMGDSFQLPPVREIRSHALTTANVHSRAALTTVMRYDGNVLRHATNVRDFIVKEKERIDRSNAVVKPAMKKFPLETLYSQDSDDFMIVPEQDEIIEMFRAAVMDEMYHCRFLAYSNNDVDIINNQIHTAIFGPNKEHYCKGAVIVPLAPIVKDRKAKKPEYLLVTEEEAVIVDTEVEHVDARLWIPEAEGEIECKRLFVIPVDKIPNQHAKTPHHLIPKYFNKYSPGVVTFLVPDKHPAGEANYKSILDYLLSAAKAKPNNETWGNFWDCKYAVESVRLAYATTVYKCQGSTYDAVFIATENILKSLKKASNELFNRAIYTAITRSAIAVICSEIIYE